MSDESTHLWPDVPRTAFREGGRPPYASAIGWALSRPGFDAYATGYRRAAEALFAAMVHDRLLSPDIVAFPLAMLWRHCFELRLKEIIRLGRDVEQEIEAVPEGHRLIKLWRLALPYIRPLGDPDSPILTNAATIIEEIEKLDGGGQGFRYPVLTNGVRSLQGIPNVLDLAALEDAMVSLANFFDGVSAELHVRRDWVWEQEAAQRDEGRR